MIHHVHARIDSILTLGDEELLAMFGGDPKEIRTELLERKSNGEELIGSENCNDFDPITGCPGHEQ